MAGFSVFLPRPGAVTFTFVTKCPELNSLGHREGLQILKRCTDPIILRKPTWGSLGDIFHLGRWESPSIVIWLVSCPAEETKALFLASRPVTVGLGPRTDLLLQHRK